MRKGVTMLAGVFVAVVGLSLAVPDQTAMAGHGCGGRHHRRGGCCGCNGYYGGYYGCCGQVANNCGYGGCGYNNGCAPCCGSGGYGGGGYGGGGYGGGYGGAGAMGGAPTRAPGGNDAPPPPAPEPGA